MKRNVCIFLALCLVGCATTSNKNEAKTIYGDLEKVKNQQAEIVEILPYNTVPIKSISALPESENGIVDIRYSDLRNLSIKNIEQLNDIWFTKETKWPKELPDTFNPESVMDLGRNPGLNIQNLHKQGITGEGVNIAIIDQGLNPNHFEFENRIMWYEEIHSFDSSVSMHGPAVTGLAVGKTIGVAPDAKVYYVATSFIDASKEGNAEVNLEYMAKGIDRILEVNEKLADEDKIKVISVSRGFSLFPGGEKGSQAVYDSIERAKKEGIFVITTTSLENYNINLLGLGRDFNYNPDLLSSYKKGKFLEDTMFYDETSINLWVPMDSRTLASAEHENSYLFTSQGGLSWTCPWLAGMFALCLQVEPNLTYQEFIDIALKTGELISTSDGSIIRVIQPERIIKEVQSK